MWSIKIAIGRENHLYRYGMQRVCNGYGKKLDNGLKQTD